MSWKNKEIMYKNKIAKLEFALLVDEERYRLIAEYSDCALWEYDIASDKVVQHKKLGGKYADARVSIEHFGETMVNRGTIHQEDQHIFEAFCQSMREGNQFITYECRILSEENEYIWVRYEGKTVYDKEDKPVKVVGKTINITKDKQEKEILMKKAKIDALTGLLNKAAIKELLEESLNRYSTHAEKEIYAVYVIDIDNFKSVNDTFGHLYGDYTIEKVALILQQVFAKLAYAGRIGGDEFVVFAKGYTKMPDISKAAEDLLSAIGGTVFNQGNTITISVGISIYPKDGLTYEDLLKKADIALYESKHAGKNAYTIYREGMQYKK